MEGLLPLSFLITKGSSRHVRVSVNPYTRYILDLKLIKNCFSVCAPKGQNYVANEFFNDSTLSKLTH